MSQLFIPFDTSSAPRAPDAFGHVLSAEQERVRDAGVEHLVVVAGAGTGKTELLTQRVLKLLLEGGGDDAPAELEGVVALTFTNKAASEMRSRVYRALVRRLRRTDAAAERARLLRLRARFADENRILTFDSLASRLLSMFPEHPGMSRVARLPTAGEERALVRALHRQFWAWAETFDADEAEELFLFLAIFERREDALKQIRDTAHKPLGELETLAALPTFGDHAALLLDVLDERTDRLWSAHTAAVAAIDDLSPAPRARLLDAAVARLPSTAGGVLTADGWSAPVKRDLPTSLVESARTTLAKRLLSWREADRDGEARRDSLLLCDEYGVGDPLWEREWRSRRAVASLARYALWWRKAEAAWKEFHKLADFADIQRAALQLLQVPEVASALRAEIAWLLVDEFQDTSPDQWQVIQSLRRHANGDTLGNTLLVGDPKQAIYEFRGGDLRVFDEGRRALEAEDAHFERLTISRRSAPPLVEWTNRVFEKLLPAEDAPREAFEAAHGPLEAAPDVWDKPRAVGDVPGVYPLIPAKWSPAAAAPVVKATLDASRRDAANALASWLLELLDDARSLGSLASGTAPKQPNFSSISSAIARGETAVAVLFSNNTVKSLFEEVLRARGVPFESLKGKGFFTSDAVRWSVLLWRALLDAEDESAWTGLLRSPLGGQSDVALLERFVARHDETDEAHEWTPSDALDNAMWRAARPRLERWRSLAGVLPASELLERVLEESEVAFYEANFHDARVRREDWLKVLDLVRKREAEGEGGLRALVDFFEANAGNDDEPHAPLPSGASIQLMTVHAAKGLGFPACVLAQLEVIKPKGGDNLLLWGEIAGAPLAAFSLSREREEDGEGTKVPPAPLAHEILRAVAVERAEAEWKRLFYVACTRAQSHLVLLQTLADPPSGSWGAFARPALGGLQDLLPALATATVALPSAPLPLESADPIEAPEEPSPLPEVAAREVRFDVLWGEPSQALTDAKVRQFLERELRTRDQSAEDLRQDVPMGARGALFGRSEKWIVGAWEWLAPLDAGGVLLAATGESEATARARSAAMQKVAEAAGVAVEVCYALWEESGELRSGVVVMRG